MIADVEDLHALRKRLHDFGIAMADVVGSAVEMQVDQTPAANVPDEVVLTSVDHQIDAGVGPELSLVRVANSWLPSRALLVRVGASIAW
jgi:hypothetical protein